MVTSENYQSACFLNQELVAFISIGADLAGHEIYYVTTTDNSVQQDLSQRDFVSLPEALEYLNHRFAQWSFYDPHAPVSTKSAGCGCSSGGGCGR